MSCLALYQKSRFRLFKRQSATQPFLVSSRNAPPRKGEERCVTTLKTAVQQTIQTLDSAIHRIYHCPAEPIALSAGQRFIRWIALSTFRTTGPRFLPRLREWTKAIQDNNMQFNHIHAPALSLERFQNANIYSQLNERENIMYKSTKLLKTRKG